MQVEEAIDAGPRLRRHPRRCLGPALRLLRPCRRLRPSVEDRYSFIVMDLHHLLFAGLPAHPIPAVRGTPIEPQGSTALTVIRPNVQLLAVIRRAGAQLHRARLANARSPNVIGRPSASTSRRCAGSGNDQNSMTVGIAQTGVQIKRLLFSSYDRSSSNVFAALRSAVANPSVKRS
jgi:hypothetical protein